MICRLCLQDFVNVIYIFDIGGREMDVATIVGKHFWFEPRNDDPISTAICSNCWLKLSNFHEFYKSVEHAHRQLADRFLVKTEPKPSNPYRSQYNADNVSVEVTNSLPSKSEPCDDLSDELYEIPLSIFPEDHLTQETNNLPNNEINMEMNTVCSPSLINQQQQNQPSSKITNTDSQENEKIDDDVDNHCDVTFDDEIFLKSLLKEQLSANEFVKQENPIEIGSPPRRSARLTAIKNTNSPSSHNQNTIEYDNLADKAKCARPFRDGSANSKQSTSKSSEESDLHSSSMQNDIDEQISKYMALICELCSKEFMNFTMLKKHMSGEHKIQGYAKCCNKKFLKRVLLLDHIRKHLNPDCYKCEECDRVFADKQTMRNHFLIKHQKDEDKIHECKQCPKKFVKKYLLMQHSMFAHVDRSTTCKNCNKRFDTLAMLHTHTKEHCNYGIMCDICAKVIRGREAFKRHQLEHEGVILPKVQCDECGSWHKDKYTLNKHKKRHRESKIPHICDICQKVSPSRAAMLSHKRYVHNAVPTFECSICNKTFKRSIYLREHMATHTGEILYNCPHCTKTFNSNANMHSHRKRAHPKEFEETRKLRRKNIPLGETSLPPSTSVFSSNTQLDISTNPATVTEEKNNINPEIIKSHLNHNAEKRDGCKRVFADKQIMRNHFLIKHKKDAEKIHECKQCPKKFIRKYLLMQHTKFAHKDTSTTCRNCNKKFDTVAQLHLHTRQLCRYGHQLEYGATLSKVQCDECGSWHKDKHNLSEHKKRHRESKIPHICEICQKISPSRSALLSHRRLVHNTSRIFECDVCKKSFKRFIYWREHMATHTGEVLYRCPHCTRTFNSNGNMHSHRKKAHPKEFEELRKLRREHAHLSKPPVPTISVLCSAQRDTPQTSELVKWYNSNTIQQIVKAEPIHDETITPESNNSHNLYAEC